MPGYIDKVVTRFNISHSSTAASPAVYIPRAPYRHDRSPWYCRHQDASRASRLPSLLCSRHRVYHLSRCDAHLLATIRPHSGRRRSDGPPPPLLRALSRQLSLLPCLLYDSSNPIGASYLSRPNARSVAGRLFYLDPLMVLVTPSVPSSQSLSPLSLKQNMQHYLLQDEAVLCCAIFSPV